MDILGGGPPSLLLDHLLVPAGTRLTAQVDSRGSFHLPKSLDFLEELSRFRIHLHVREFYPSIRFSAPNCQISIIPATSPPATTCRVLESLAQLDPSNIERLRLADGDLMLRDGCDFYRALPKMSDLRSITISRCKNLSDFLPFLNSSAAFNLEGLVIDPRVDGEKFNIQNVIELAARRASRGSELKSVKIVIWDKSVQRTAEKLQEHVSHVECSPRVALESDDVDNSDEED